MTFALVPYRELTAWRFAETGRPTLVVRGPRHIAICSAFDVLFWSGRAVYDGHRPRQRVVLYETTDTTGERRVAVFDETRMPINDVAFHPTEPILAIASGTYDGGYAFEGQLIVWNWETGDWHSVLGESREVTRCRFEPDGRLAILIRPRTDEEDGYFGTILDDLRAIDGGQGDARLADLTPIQPEALGFSDDDAPRSEQTMFELAERGIEARSRIWDIAWIDGGRIAVARADGVIEIWAADGHRERALQSTGSAVQLLRQPEQLLVNVTSADSGSARSTLFAVRDELVEWATFRSPRVCSVDATGCILARDAGAESRPGRDRVIAATGEVLLDADLGYYDAFNSYLRIDGDRDLYFLRGTPPGQHLAKTLCSIGANEEIREEMAWDPPGDGHLMVGSAALVGDDLVRAYCVYDPRGNGRRSVERCSLTDESVTWRHDVGAAAIALATWPAAGAVVFALVDGTLGVLDAATGAVLHEERFMIDGVATIVTALAVEGELVVLGTIDGRVLIFALR